MRLGAEGPATFTLRELEKWIAIEIAGKYHQRIHTLCCAVGGLELEVKYDPSDLSRILVRQADGRFVEARYRNFAFPPVSWWEWKHAKKRLPEQGKRELHEIIFASIALQRQIEDFASLASAIAHRSIMCRPHQLIDQDGGGVTAIDLTKPIHPDDMEFLGPMIEPPYLVQGATAVLTHQTLRAFESIRSDHWVGFSCAFDTY